MFSYLAKSLCFLFSVSIIIVPFLKFLTVFGLIFVDIIFCIRNGDSFVNGVSSSDSNMTYFFLVGVVWLCKVVWDFF